MGSITFWSEIDLWNLSWPICMLYGTDANNLKGNHAGYRQLKGTRSSAQEIGDIYEGLRQSYLTDFDVLLSGYAPSAAAVEAVGKIAVDIQKRAESKPGSFFWGMHLPPFRISRG